MRSLALSVAAILLCAYSQPGRADSFYELLRYRCKPAQHRIEIEYVGAYNEDGERLFSSRTSDDVNPWELIVMEKGDYPKMVAEVKSIERRCVLSGEKFQIALGPEPCNFNIQGQNGGMMKAYVQVRSRGRVVAETTFGACGIEGHVRTKLIVRPGRAPTVLQKRAEDYFK